MVMEAPSPQCVGQEFVRQYYTLLHEEPGYMHRFYSHDSCYVHGGIEKPGEEQPPIQGQDAIHKKILSLNFRDCHAKIRQVDSQGTLDGAVVVQVSGELSNNGQAMRRFMQTFILAPQTPKKYYVHNDIFRYQDEVFHDETDIPDSEAVDVGENVDKQQPLTQMPLTPMSNMDDDSEERGDQIVDKMEANNGVHVTVDYNGDWECKPTPESEISEVKNGGENNPEPPAVITPRSPRITNQSPDSTRVSSSSSVRPTPPLSMPHQGKSKQSVGESIVVSSERTERDSKSPTLDGNRQMSWAALAAGKNSSTAAISPVSPKPQATVKPEVNKEVDVFDMPTTPPQHQSPPSERSSLDRDGTFLADGNPDSQARTMQSNHQLFVGNLPHDLTNDELRDYFEKTFGGVQDVRVSRKALGRDVPNFGFVSFENADIVQKVLDSRPLFLGDGHRINVEEKKQNDRPGSGGVRGSFRGFDGGGSGYRYNTGRGDRGGFDRGGYNRGGYWGSRGRGAGFNSGGGRNYDANNTDKSFSKASFKQD